MKAKLIVVLLMAISSHLFAQQGWQYQNSNLSGNQYGAICALTKDIVYVMADQGNFLKTMDGGTTWTELNTGFPGHFFDMACSPTGIIYAIGGNGQIIRSYDGGTTWTSLPTGTTQDLFSICLQAPADVWVVGDSGVILHSTDNGNNWTLNNSLTNKRLNSIGFSSYGKGYIAGNSGTLFKTVDEGLNWNPVNIATTKDLFSITVTTNEVYLLAGSVNSYLYTGDEFFRTSDHINWTNYYFPMSGPGISRLSFRYDSIGFCVSSYLTTNGDAAIIIFKTSDSGLEWYNSLTSLAPPSMVGIGYADFALVTDSIGYILCGDNILKTIDGGTYVGIKELKTEPRIKISPNPAISDHVTIELNQFVLGSSIEISDIHGKTLYQRSNAGTKNLIDTTPLGKGIFFVKLLVGNRVAAVEKFVITP